MFSNLTGIHFDVIHKVKAHIDFIADLCRTVDPCCKNHVSDRVVKKTHEAESCSGFCLRVCFPVSCDNMQIKEQHSWDEDLLLCCGFDCWVWCWESQPPGRKPEWEGVCVCWVGEKLWWNKLKMTRVHKFTLCWKITVDFSDILKVSNVMLMLLSSGTGCTALNSWNTTKRAETFHKSPTAFTLASVLIF